MSESITTQCPRCKARLKLKSQAAIGKTLPCPKCQHKFVVQPLVEAVEEVPLLSEADLSPEGQGLPAEPDWMKQFGSPSSALPPLAARPAAPAFKPRKKSAGWQKPALIAGGGLLGVVLLIGVIWLVVSSFSGPAVASRLPVAPAEPPPTPVQTGLDLAYLPLGAELIVSVRLADCFQAPVLQPLLGSAELQPQLNELRNTVGLGPADIQSVTIGVAGLAEIAKQKQAQPPARSGLALPLVDWSKLPWVAVVRTSVPVDQQKVVNYVAQQSNLPSGDVKSLTHEGKPYFAFGPKSAIHFANSKTVLFGVEDAIKSAITRGGTPEPRPELEFVDEKQHLVFAAVGNSAASLNLPGASSPDQTNQLQKSLNESAKAMSFGVTVTDTLALKAQVACADAAAASKLMSQLDPVLQQQLAQQRESMAQTREQLKQLEALGQKPPAEIVKMYDVLEAIINSVKAEVSGQTVVVRAAAPSSVGALLAKIPQTFIGGMSPRPPAASRPGSQSPGN